MKTALIKQTSVRTPFMENRLQPEELELVLDTWCNLPEGTGASSRSISSPSTVSFASAYENAPPATPSPMKSGKRWGIFKRKKFIPIITVTPITDAQSPQYSSVHKKSRVLTKRNIGKTRSSPDLKTYISGPLDLSEVNMHDSPIPIPSGTPFRATHSRPPLSIPRDNIVPAGSSSSAIYFTVDPVWDQSKGDAEVYLLPSPSLTADHGELPTASLDKSPRNVVTMHLRDIEGIDNQTSFLFI